MKRIPTVLNTNVIFSHILLFAVVKLTEFGTQHILMGKFCSTTHRLFSTDTQAGTCQVPHDSLTFSAKTICLILTVCGTHCVSRNQLTTTTKASLY